MASPLYLRANKLFHRNLPFDAVPEGFVDVEVNMYSGHLMDELTEMVARAERHATELMATPETQPETVAFYAPRYLYGSSNQQALVGVA